MRAMILAAGRGERMGALTQATPKALLKVGGKYLIEYTLAQLQAAGICEVVMNVSYHADQIQQVLGDGRQYGLSIQYSFEPERLETGGGIVKALPYLGNNPFLVLSADIITDFPLHKLPKQLNQLAHLILVPNPSYHVQGDFGLRDCFLDLNTRPYHTFANIGVYHPELFHASQPVRFPLSELLFPAIQSQRITGEYYPGNWYNIGTPQDIEHVNKVLTTATT